MLRFGTSGIRGIFNKEINLQNLLTFSKSLASLYPSPFTIARDTRLGSGIISEFLKACLSWLGVKVIDLGLLPTPILAYSTKILKANLGIEITASHNPAEYTGIKLFNYEGMSLPRDEEEIIEGKMNMGKEEDIEFKRQGNITERHDMINKYVEDLLKRLPETRRRLKIIVDCANGAGSIVTPLILSKLGHRVITLNSHTSWSFVGRNPEPTPKNLENLSKIVNSIKPDLTIAHDGDADRAVILTKDGKVIPDHEMSAVYLLIMLERGLRGNVVLSVNMSNAVEEVAKNANCKVYRARLGKTYVELKKLNGIFSTEPSKIIDATWGFWEDGILAAATIAQYLSSNDISLKEIIAKVPKYYFTQINLVVSKKDYKRLKEVIVSHNFNKKIQSIEELDGIKLNFEDGSWLLIRFSGTEPKARSYAEAKNEKESRTLAEIGANIIKKTIS
jgi:phosphoglucosamine mutase